MRRIPQASIASGITTPINIGTVAATVIYNESPLALEVQLGSNGPSAWLPAWTADLYNGLKNISGFDGFVNITPQSISSSINAPSSVVLINTFEAGETIGGTYPVSLTRQTNLGNGVISTSAANSVIVSGETVPNDLVKSSPLGYASATITIRDDGTVIVYGLHNGVAQTLFSITPGVGASAAAMVILASILGSLTISGTMTATTLSGALAATNLTAGAINAGVTLPGSQLTAGHAPTGVTLGATTRSISCDGQVYSGYAGIVEDFNTIQIASKVATRHLVNAYNDGSNDRYLSTNYAFEINIAGNGGYPYWRFANSGTAGAVITWNAISPMVLYNTAGGGSVGKAIWEGTTDPGGSASEGDLWVSA